MMVRARVKADLQSLVCLPIVEEWNCKIVETPDADYRYRIIVSRTQLQTIVQMVCSSLDYSNFKDRIYSRDPERERIYHQVWALLRHLESSEARPAEAPSASASPLAKKATRPRLSR